MKKSTKITLIVAMVLMLVGGIVALVCLLLGGTLDYYSDGWMVKEDHQIADWDEWFGNGEGLETWTFEEKEIDSLDLDIEAGTLYIQRGDSYKVAVENGRHGMRCDVKNGVLTLKETDSIHTLLDWSGKNTPVIRVMIPETAEIETAHITVGAGSVEVESLAAARLDVDVDAGNVTIRGLTVDDFCEIDVDAGNVDIGAGQIQGDLDVDVDAGMVVYRGSLAGDWQVDCSAGDIELELIGSEKDFDYKIDYDMGTVKIGDKEYTGMSDQIHFSNGAKYQAQIQCDVGQVKISFTR